MAPVPTVPTWNNSAPIANTPKYKRTRLWTWGRETWAGDLSRVCKRFCHEINDWVRVDTIVPPSMDLLTDSVAFLQSSASGSEFESERDAPIFLLSAGWRAGSTLLQRILVTDPRLLLWGEPLGEMTLMSKLAEMVGHFVNPVLLRSWGAQPKVGSASLSTSWIANLYPSATDFRRGLRSIFDQWLAEPARERGFSRWGFKEVRLGATEATFLHWLYPKAKFVLICRHPYDAYRSLVDSHWQVYYRYPDIPIDSAASFARLWNQLVLSWSEMPADFPCMRIKYEDIISGTFDFRRLESWLGIQIKENVALSASVGGTAKRKRLAWYERQIIQREAEAGLKVLDYAA